MRYVAAYMLAVLGGNAEPSSDDIKRILGSVGIEADEEKMNKVINELHGKDLQQVIAAGRERLSSMPGGAAGAADMNAAPSAGEADKPQEEEKKEEKVEVEDSSDEDMGFGLFD